MCRQRLEQQGKGGLVAGTLPPESYRHLGTSTGSHSLVTKLTPWASCSGFSRCLVGRGEDKQDLWCQDGAKQTANHHNANSYLSVVTLCEAQGQSRGQKG